ncbi:MAG: flagellar biosynthesis anti-sigma factor FlgM [Chloroflexi bacterium]|nr:flagellar biosynthesis anti-sigma factor FlgM [Chloroflexota bacterium]
MPELRKPSGVTSTGAVVYDISAARRRVAARSAAASDRSGVSEAGRELSRALLAAEESPELRAEKIRALRAQIANGSYRPDPRDVARSMLERGF